MFAFAKKQAVQHFFLFTNTHFILKSKVNNIEEQPISKNESKLSPTSASNKNSKTIFQNSEIHIKVVQFYTNHFFKLFLIISTWSYLFVKILGNNISQDSNGRVRLNAIRGFPNHNLLLGTSDLYLLESRDTMWHFKT